MSSAASFHCITQGEGSTSNRKKEESSCYLLLSLLRLQQRRRPAPAAFSVRDECKRGEGAFIPAAVQVPRIKSNTLNHRNTDKQAVFTQ